MVNNERIPQLLVETEPPAFKDLDYPVILASGELGIYYINSENLSGDPEIDKNLKKYANNSQAMIEHAIRMTKEHPTFKEVIDILSEYVRGLLSQANPTLGCVVSGGQRRDWLFSGPVARNLEISHISLYKDGKIEVIDSHGNIAHPDIDGLYDVHVSDLLTKGSSAYRIEGEEKKGWIPMLRNGGATVKDYVAVVTRLQGGEKNLKEIDVNTHVFVAIDEDFLRKRSKYPDRAVAYKRDTRAFNEDYLENNEVDFLLPFFDPKGKKLGRAKDFLKKYGKFVEEHGIMDKLKSKIERTYGTPLKEIIGEKITFSAK